MLKTISKVMLATLIILSTFGQTIALADSGSSTLPKKPTGLAKYYYSTYAPKSQTKYKKFSSTTVKVSKIKKEYKSFTVAGNRLMAGGGALGLLSLKVPPLAVPATVVGGTGGTVYLIGDLGKIPYKKFKSGTVIKHNIYFKWTNPNKFEYKVKIRSWASYKGKRISKVKTTYFNKSL